MPPQRRRVGYVPQEGALFPHLDVAGNIAFGLPRGARGARAPGSRSCSSWSGCRPTLARRAARTSSPAASSSGSRWPGRWRPRPSVVLLDEPFSSLDAGLREGTGRAVADALRAASATGVLVTHDQGEALSLADQVAVMRDGRLAQVGTPEQVYARPADLDVARFVGGAVVLPAVVAGGRRDQRPRHASTCPSAPPRGRSRCWCGPSRSCSRRRGPGDEPDAAPGAVPLVPGERARRPPCSEVSYFGHDCAVRLQLAGTGEQVTARMVGEDAPEPGAVVASACGTGQRLRGAPPAQRRRTPSRRRPRPADPRPPVARIRAWADALLSRCRARPGSVEVRSDLDGLDRGGFWAVVVTVRGRGHLRAVRRRPSAPPSTAPACGPRPAAALARAGLGVAQLAGRAGLPRRRGGHPRRIAAGEVYQVNLCRILSHRLPESADLHGLYDVLAEGNPAPYACLVDVPEAGLEVVSASPELFLRRSGDRGRVAPDQGDRRRPRRRCCAKDYAENVMIADLVRNDLAHVCRPGTVSVDALCAAEEHPGLVHLVTTVSGRLRPGVRLARDRRRHVAAGLGVRVRPSRRRCGPSPSSRRRARGPYCGAVGWVDADAGEAQPRRRHPHVLGRP